MDAEVVILFKFSHFSQISQYIDDINATGADNTSLKSDEYYYSGKIEVNSGMFISGAVIFTYVLACLLREIIQLSQKRYHYLFEPVNFVSWLLYINTLIMISPIFTNGYVNDFLFSSASFTIFLSWFSLLLHLQRFDQIGIYVVMFLEILQTLIKVLIVFSILIIAFGLAFFILLSNVDKPQPNHLSFSSIPMSLMRTFSMMLGEMDFVGTFIQPFHMNHLPFPYASFVILCKSNAILYLLESLIYFNFNYSLIHDSYANLTDEFTHWFGCR